MTTTIRHRLALGVLAACLIAAGCSSNDDEGSNETDGEELVGLFRIDAGACEGAEVTGSYFRMVQSGGTVEAGPYVANGDSPCEDKSVTVLRPGTDGGLVTGTYQPEPDPAFDAAGNALATLLAQPETWFAVAFGVSTNETDPQTGASAAVPTISVADGVLSGDLSAVSASWNGQQFNQGAPKPGGAAGATTGPTGTYDPDTGAFTLEWSSQIEGGPFTNFTGIWHLEGTFEPS